MRQKDLEILLSQSIHSFIKPKIQYEQYQTPANISSNLLFRAFELGDIEDREIVDICSGTGILGIGAAILGGKVTCIEIDPDAVKLLKENQERIGVPLSIITQDSISWKNTSTFDTVLMNPPFGIQQKKYRDLDFIKKAHSVANVVYSILDGSESNRIQIPKLFKKLGYSITETFLADFRLPNTYIWHRKHKSIHTVMILRSVS